MSNEGHKCIHARSHMHKHTRTSCPRPGSPPTQCTCTSSPRRAECLASSVRRAGEEKDTCILQRRCTRSRGVVSGVKVVY